MVQTYKQKNRAYLTGYNNESLKTAVRRIQSKELSVLVALKLYKIPYETLNKKIEARIFQWSKQITTLTLSMNKKIVSTINHLTDWKFPLCDKEAHIFGTARFVVTLIGVAHFGADLFGTNFMQFFFLNFLIYKNHLFC